MGLLVQGQGAGGAAGYLCGSAGLATLVLLVAGGDGEEPWELLAIGAEDWSRS